MVRFRIPLMILAGLALLGAAVFGSYVAGQGPNHDSHLSGCFAASTKAANCPAGTFDFWSFHAGILKGFSTATVTQALILLVSAFAIAAFISLLQSAALSRLRIAPLFARSLELRPAIAFSSERRWLSLHERRDPSAF
jgi:hypothetical protein